MSVAVERQRPAVAPTVEQDADGRRLVLGERSRVRPTAAGVEEQTLVRERPAVDVFAEHVDERVDVEAGASTGDAEHHARAEESPGDVHLPVVDGRLAERPGTANARRTIAPVRMEDGRLAGGAVEDDFRRRVVSVPRPPFRTAAIRQRMTTTTTSGIVVGVVVAVAVRRKTATAAVGARRRPTAARRNRIGCRSNDLHHFAVAGSHSSRVRRTSR